MAGRKPISIRERFWSKVAVGRRDDCWEWVGGTFNHAGYGEFRLPTGHIGAHRQAWELVYGLIPENTCVLHKCDNPRCVNPAHLFLGTHADNVADKVAKGRGACGEKQGQSKLTAEKVIAIRDEYTGKRGEQPIIAKKYGVTQSVVSEIVTGKAWKHLLASGGTQNS